jgi:signal transduction protein with GAF and PtsI domain
MTAPSRQDVDAMANILKALHGDKSGIQKQVATERQAREDAGIIDTTPGVKAEDIKAMENILNAFNNASQNVAAKVANTINESKKIERGVEVGSFVVEKNDDELYDIYDNRTNDTLFEDIRLYETAYLLVKHLNEGKKINSSEITKIISTNALFETYYYDAINHKRTYNIAKKRNDFPKMDIAEARFTRAKEDATLAKRQIKSLYESK